MVNVLYTAHGHATGGRTGEGATDDGKVSVQLSTPKELGGDNGPGTNPEQLFSIGYSACFLVWAIFRAYSRNLSFKPMTFLPGLSEKVEL